MTYTFRVCNCGDDKLIIFHVPDERIAEFDDWLRESVKQWREEQARRFLEKT